MRRVPDLVSLVLVCLATACADNSSGASARRPSTPNERRVQVGRITFALPREFAAESTANMSDAYHPPLHLWRRDSMAFMATGCSVGGGPDACFHSYEPSGQRVAQWKLDSAWTADIQTRLTASRHVFVGYFAAVDRPWAVKAIISGPPSTNDSLLLEILQRARLEPPTP